MNTAIATADVERGVIDAAMEFDAPPERVFRALTDPRELEAWWGSADSYRTFDWKVDLRAGGRWSCAAINVATGHHSTVEGEYLEVDPPRLLVLTWRPSWEHFAETTIRYELARTGAGGTRLTVRHSGFDGRPESCEEHAQGWTRVLGWLREGLVRQGLGTGD